MKLIGQYDSPFVRRVGVTLKLYGREYEHVPWSVWGNADQIAEYNPLRRVPTLVLEDGTALVETFAIIDALDELVGPEKALLSASGSLRRQGLRLVALVSGVKDKAVSLLYERLFRSLPSQGWTDRCRLQVDGTLSLLERELAAGGKPFFLGERPNHPDVALTCAWRFTREAHPGLIEEARFPCLGELAERCEALPAFRAVYLPITNNL